MSTIRPSDLFRYYKALPHQMAAVSELEEELLKRVPDLFDKGQPWFKTWSQSGKQTEPARPAWFAPASKIVAEFEGCRLEPYLCAAGVPTIGYGRTGKDITLGTKRINQAQADQWLAEDLQRFADGIHRLLPGSQLWGANQQAALISWALNVGLGAVESSTLRKRLLGGEPGIIVIPQELPKWDKANGKPLLGLTRRRAAEVALFTGIKPTTTPPPQPKLTPNAPFSFRVTPHITYGELCLNEERRRFVNEAQCQIATELCIFIEKARTHFGQKPVIITSGPRPPAVNQAVGGASNSEHLFQPGCGAIDWYIQGIPVKTVQDWCVKNWPYSTGLGAAKGFIHTGIRAGRPKVIWDY
jgi:GH24 family phage-related lysozyme (muramidase)